MPEMPKIKSRIIEHKKINGHSYKIIISAGKIASLAKPGQFVDIRITNGYEPLLRRPLSIHRVTGSRIELLYEVVGEGTKILSGKKRGELLDIIGPLGNGFNYRLPIAHYELPILVAGGIGVAPLYFLAEKLAPQKPLVLLGAGARDEILIEKEFKKLGCRVKISTDNGSKGFKGRVTDLLNQVLRLAINDKRFAIYACGPHLMLKEVARLAKKYQVPAQVSLDEHMACGIGACLGCVVKTKNGYQRACKEGPVFNAQEVIW